MKQLLPAKRFLEKKPKKILKPIEQVTKATAIEPYNNISIEELQLSVRSYNCLKKAQINNVADLLRYSPKKLLELRNFGRKSADEVFSLLKTRFGIIVKEN